MSFCADDHEGPQSGAETGFNSAEGRQSGAESAAAGSSENAVDTMSVEELRRFIAQAGLSSADCLEKAELRARASEAAARAGSSGRADGFVPEPDDTPPAGPDEAAAGGAAAGAAAGAAGGSPQPVVTYLAVALIGLSALLCQLGLVEPHHLAYLPEHAPLDIWRPLTCFFFFDDNISFNLMLSLAVTLIYTSRLELGDYAGRRSDFAALLLYSMVLLISICTVLWAAGLGYWQTTPWFLLGPQLLDTLMVVFCLRNPDTQMHVPLTDFAVRADRYIWVNIVIGLVLSCDDSSAWTEFGAVFERELLGVAAGHIAFYLPLGKRCLPGFIRRACGDEMPAAETASPRSTGWWQYCTNQGRASRSQYWSLVAKVAVLVAVFSCVAWHALSYTIDTESFEVEFVQPGPLGLKFERMDDIIEGISLVKDGDGSTLSVEGIVPGTQAEDHREVLLGAGFVRGMADTTRMTTRITAVQGTPTKGLDANATLGLLRTDVRPLTVAFRRDGAIGAMGWAIIGGTLCVWGGALVVVLFATARRLHDTSRSTCRLLCAGIPVLGSLAVVFWLLCEGDADVNWYGAPSSAAGPGAAPCSEEPHAELQAKLAASEAENAALRQQLDRAATELAEAKGQAEAQRQELDGLLRQAGHARVPVAVGGGNHEYETQVD
jgi:uncharacterized membrane protein YhaH (DUF805 family)